MLSGFWFLSKLGPQKSITAKWIYPGSSFQELQSAGNLALEEQFEEILVLRDAQSADVALLHQALQAQERYLDLLRGYDAEAILRRDTLLKRYQDMLAADLLQESYAFEKEVRGSSRRVIGLRPKRPSVRLISGRRPSMKSIC